MKVKRYIYLFFIFLPLVLLFQNCTEREYLLSKPEDIGNLMEKTTFNIRLCPDVEYLNDEKNKFVFILDLSYSNLGSYYKKPSGYYYWTESTATDLDDQRFKAIKNFITTCASSENNEFAIIGFSKKAGRVKTNYFLNRPYLSCVEDISFFGADSALAELDSFEQAVQVEKNFHKQFIDKPYSTPSRGDSDEMAYTSYSAGIECAKKTVLDDIIKNQSEETSSYHMIFVSDGAPVDPSPEDYEESCEKKGYSKEKKEECYSEAVKNPLLEISKDLNAVRKKLNLYAIGYGSSVKNGYRYLNDFSQFLGGNEAEKLESFGQSTNIFCQMAASRLGIEVKSDILGMAPLTLQQSKGVYYPDSDMDGVLDKDEEDLGYEVLNARTHGHLLDGLCKKVGGPHLCKNLSKDVNCNKTKFYSDGLSDCDKEVLKKYYEYESLMIGPDWDKDGVPNYVEVIKSMNPLLNDISEDPDNDGLSNLYEIMRGLNPFENSTAYTDVMVELENSIDTKNKQCLFQSKDLTLQSVPAVESRAYQDSNLPDFAHEKNEHMLMVFSTSVQQNYENAPGKMKGAVVLFKRILNTNKAEDFGYLAPEINTLTDKELVLWSKDEE